MNFHRSSPAISYPPPSPALIGQTAEGLKNMLFPEALESETTLQELRTSVRSLIGQSLAARAAGHEQRVPHLRDILSTATITTEKFFAALRAVLQRSRTDICAALRNDPAANDAKEVIAYYPGFQAVLLQRMAHTLWGLDVPYLPRGITEYAHRTTGIDIHPGATIGDGFFIDHGTGVVIGETATIGNDVTLYQGVTLGAKSFRYDNDGKVVREAKRHPTVEDNVVIYANATILGGETVIGKDSIIGGGVWLTESVEPGSRVTLNAPSIKKKRIT